MKVLIIVNGAKRNAMRISGNMVRFLKKRGIEAVRSVTGRSTEKTEVPEDVGLAISVGGDGTVLYTARAVHGMNIPILPINLGSFGYITEFSVDEWEEALEDFLEGRFETAERQMLDILATRNGEKMWECSALNDAVLSSSKMAKIISLSIWIDSTLLGSFRGDGMIVSTATGSTGYSLAAGGPILESEMSALVITPICPFTLSNRPVVTSGHTISISVPYLQRTSIVLSADGQLTFNLSGGDVVYIEKSDSPALLIKSKKRNFADIIRDKLNWSGAFHA